MLPHRAVCNYLVWSARTYVGEGAGDGDANDGGAMAHSSIAFDLTVTSLFLPLITGRPVHLDPAWRDAFALSADLADRSGLDLLKLTPSHLKVVNHTVEPGDLAGTVSSLVLGGEALDGEAVGSWLAHAPGTRVFNEYGPTETAVGVCVHEVGVDDGPGPVPTGRPIDHAEVLVLDSASTPWPWAYRERSTSEANASPADTWAPRTPPPNGSYRIRSRHAPAAASTAPETWPASTRTA